MGRLEVGTVLVAEPCYIIYDGDVRLAGSFTFVVDNLGDFWSVMGLERVAQRYAIQRWVTDGFRAAVYDNTNRTLVVVPVGARFDGGRLVVSANWRWSYD